MPEWLASCTVNNAGPAADGTETVPPTVYINLSDGAGTFADQWFYAAENCKSQMLDVALAAVSLKATVACVLDAPNQGNMPFTQIYRLFLNAVPPMTAPPPPRGQLSVTLSPPQLPLNVPTRFTITTVDSITRQPVTGAHVTIHNFTPRPTGAPVAVTVPGVGSPITASGITFHLGKSIDPVTHQATYDKLPTIEVDAPGYTSVFVTPEFPDAP